MFVNLPFVLVNSITVFYHDEIALLCQQNVVFVCCYNDIALGKTTGCFFDNGKYFRQLSVQFLLYVATIGNLFFYLLDPYT